LWYKCRTTEHEGLGEKKPEKARRVALFTRGKGKKRRKDRASKSKWTGKV